ncbi:hypothetical protein [Frankia sp. Cas4]|nr:hypothetical protein [Frankia sp. Cas4]
MVIEDDRECAEMPDSGHEPWLSGVASILATAAVSVSRWPSAIDV